MKFHPLEFKTSKLLLQYKLLNSPILALVSGGPDSMALALVLKKLSHGGPFNPPFSLKIFHGNHGTRGEDSTEDERFVAEFAASHGIVFYSEPLEQSVWRAQRQNFHQFARQWRYRVAHRLCEPQGVIATGHHSQDNVESILMHIIRGSGLQGIRGLEVLSGRLFRPFLDAQKDHLLKYLKDMGQNYRIDKSNASTYYTRNRVRLELIPLLESINPQFSKALLRLREAARSVGPSLPGSLPQNFPLGELREKLIHIHPQVASVLTYNVLSNLYHHLMIWEQEKKEDMQLHLGSGWLVKTHGGQLNLTYLPSVKEKTSCRYFEHSEFNG